MAPEHRRAKRMEQKETAHRTCPACGSTDYVFRGRKKIEAEPGKQAAVETKYRCRACGKEWRVKAD
jgi:DNA-directed RNA polymerase subunit M/transcription elongation factor TFIIS